jgi:hypothetical protein
MLFVDDGGGGDDDAVDGSSGGAEGGLLPPDEEFSDGGVVGCTGTSEDDDETLSVRSVTELELFSPLPAAPLGLFAPCGVTSLPFLVAEAFSVAVKGDPFSAPPAAAPSMLVDGDDGFPFPATELDGSEALPPPFPAAD